MDITKTQRRQSSSCFSEQFVENLSETTITKLLRNACDITSFETSLTTVISTAARFD